MQFSFFVDAWPWLRPCLPIAVLFCLLLGCAKEDHDIILTDGKFNEWTHTTAILTDSLDAPPDAAIDLAELKLMDEPQWLHMALDVTRPVNAQSMHGTLLVLFDADGDIRTGAKVEGLEGVDAITELSRVDLPRPGGYGAGLGIRPVTESGPAELASGYDSGVLVAPTHAATRFEIRLRRGDVLSNGIELFSQDSVRLKLVFKDDQGVRDETAAVAYAFKTENSTAAVGKVFTGIGKLPGTFRVVQWNVAGESFRSNADAFTRILAALEPDIIMLDEVYESVTPEDLRGFFARDLLATRGEWRFVLGRSGGRQKNVVATRKTIRPEERLLDVRYPAGALEALGRAVGDTTFGRVLDVEAKAGLAIAGAWVDVGGREALFVALDLESAGYVGSPRDRLRELQGRILHNEIAEVQRASAAESRPFALVVAGDFNLVGGTRPLDLLRGKISPGKNPLSIAEAYRLNDRSQATWRDVERGAFTPGRLDFIIYSAASLKLEKSFVFNCAELPESQRARLGLHGNDSKVTSDHLPVVGDFKLVD